MSAPCTCTAYRRALNLAPDADSERVAAMVAAGIGQWQASRAVWGGEPLPPLTPAEVPGWVRLKTALRFPSLRMEAGSAESLPVALFCLLAAVCVVVAAVR